MYGFRARLKVSGLGFRAWRIDWCLQCKPALDLGNLRKCRLATVRARTQLKKGSIRRCPPLHDAPVGLCCCKQTAERPERYRKLLKACVYNLCSGRLRTCVYSDPKKLICERLKHLTLSPKTQNPQLAAQTWHSTPYTGLVMRMGFWCTSYYVGTISVACICILRSCNKRSQGLLKD